MRRNVYWLAPLVVLLLSLLVALTWLLMTESGLRWAFHRLHASVPGTLEVQQLEGRLAGPLRIRGLRYNDRTADVRIDRLTFDWSPLALLIARLKVQALSVHGVRVRLTPSDAPPPSSGSLKLPVAIRIEQIELGDIEIQRTGHAPFQVESLEFAGKIAETLVQIDRLEVNGREFQLSAQGALGVGETTNRIDFTWRLRPPALATIAGNGEIVGNLENFSLVQRITEPVAAELRASVANALSAPKWKTELNVPPAALAKVKPSWSGTLGVHMKAHGDAARFQTEGGLQARHPAAPNVVGNFRLRGTTGGRIDLDELTLHVPNSEQKLTANGRYHADKASFDATLRWQNVGWPLTDRPFLMSRAGEMQIVGTPAAYRATLTAKTGGAGIPAADWRIAGAGDASRLALESIAVKTLDGVLQGTANVAWSPQLRWEAHIQGQHLNPGSTWREWPGALGFTARLAGNAEETSAQLQELRGQLRGRPVTGHARVVRRGADYPVLALALQSGDANVNIAGSVRAQWDVSWQIDAPNLAGVLPGASGRARGNGQITGKRAAPAFRARLTAAAFDYNSIRFEKFDADASIDFSNSSSSRINLQLLAAEVDKHKIDQLTLLAEGPIADHRLALDLRVPDIVAHMRFTGAYDDAVWRGKFLDSALRLAGQNWTPADPPELMVSAKRIKLGQACWRAQTARLCTQLDWNAGGDTTLGFIADRAPLALVAALLPRPVELRGGFDADARAHFKAGRIVSADARFNASSGNARLATAGAGLALQYQRLHGQLRVDDAGLQGRVEFALVNGDGGSATIALPEFAKSPQAKPDQPVEGRFTLAVRNLSPFAALLPDATDLKGSLHAEFSLRGTLADPVVNGQARLTEAGARITGNGILLRDMRLIASADGRRQVRLNGYARSGTGEVGVSGWLNLEKGLAWRGELRIAGSDFQAADLPETSLDVSPDLYINLSPGEVNVQGEVVVPRARIKLRQGKGGIGPSPDVVVIGDETEATVPALPWDVTAQIRVTLGDDVTFEGFGLTGNITGALTIIEAPGQVTAARGELRILNGKYEAYGQKLEIERGRLLFVGGPIDDPGIDVRAVRHIDQIVAGVEVRGTLKSAELTLFSDPTMSESDALSYLLFGKPIESANAAQGATLAAAARALQLAGGERLAQRLGARFGIQEVEIEKAAGTDQAALVLGKRLSPRLYINYSIGLFESVNVFRIRYQLSTRWILQAESGVNKGGDLLYTIER